MAKCVDCQKTQQTGHRLSINRSNVSRRANRVWKPNIKKVHVVEGDTTNKKTIYLCAACLRNRKHIHAAQ